MYPIGIEVSFESAAKPIYAIVDGYEEASDPVSDRAVRITTRSSGYEKQTVLADHPSLYAPLWAKDDFDLLAKGESDA